MLITGGSAAAAVAAAGEFAGISLVANGAPIPVSEFVMLTLIFSVAGLVPATGLARWARRPRTAFVRATLALTALSLVPDVLIGASVATKVLLMMTHVVASAIVIPSIARRLSA
ncbi:hypothetical protein ITP53_11950 [Nonomuraea sp. K274]|uniref:Uncharacterized protein n=1 Tax=Nonomuraea cypriaca TaxID=1187855 RepID=A0A931F0J9_9ACTN|nr:DUF6069 family protein [Nonomuraea cypriaca]MBF8186443.1 hypothetical protein [Nonomuraea cypriaca]